MDYSQLVEANIIRNEELPIIIESIENLNYEGYYSINGKVPIRIVDMSSMYKQDEPVELFDEQGNEIGLIYYCNNRKKNLLDSLNEWKFIAYLFEVKENMFLKDEYEFEYSYLLLGKEYFSDYMDKYFKTAPIWGHFSHQDVFPAPYKKNLQRISVVSDLEYHTTVHQDNALRTLKQPYAFERYLKLYHHMELLFDKDLVEKISSLRDDFTELGILLKSFEDSESKKLISVMENRCTDIDSICSSLNLVERYKDIAKKIFFDFGKKSDPLGNDFSLLESILLEAGGFNEQNCKKYLPNKAKDREKFEKFIISLSAYWIYRIRCSIAHNKIGEYILNHREEEFVSEFGETLINTVVLQVLKKKST
ncbi:MULTISPECIES: hypothetical protein [Bacillus cereus group]|uniref:hypothetical protein n=1 Tax=Bacillus cereus group TaxID=86661 RepID=UPI000BF280F1|nr:hypothetical protein [Bacillus toyonensis]PGB57797.1 hypothetical protein COM00_25370 [Bacillus toyonensis]